ncbi:MAG: hypothetical protein U1A78_18520 [Polyangia bacterium]
MSKPTPAPLRRIAMLALPLLCSLALSLGATGGCTGPNPDQAGDADLGPAMTEADLAGTGDNTDLQSSGDTDLGGNPGDTVATECKNLATALCGRLGKCSQYLLRYYYGDEKTCAERIQLTCAPYVKLPGSSWTVERLKQCAAGYSTGTCDDYFAPGGPKACQPAAGLLADGAACAAGDQCKGAYCSNSATSSGCGTCATPAKSGEACSALKPCGLGLTCASGRCAPQGGVGAACGTGAAPCKSGLYCKSGTCATALAAGATCDPAAGVSGCDSLQGLFCGTTSRKCETYKLANTGEACGTVMTSTVLCAAGGSCSGTGTNRKCAAAARDGEACGPTAGSAQCMSPAACTSARCAVFDPSTCK